jgi:peroxiredoxin
MSRLDVGDVLDRRELLTIQGESVQLPDRDDLVHLQFRRYAGCPVCNLHLRSIARRRDEIRAAGIREIAVFHSSAETMRRYQGELPFAVIADPGKVLYAEFGVQKMSPTAALHPRSWRAAGRALTRAPSLRGAAGMGEQHMGQPANFLIGTDGRLVAVQYGRFVDEHWSVDELLALAGRAEPAHS